jgi:hypothetical protein
VMTHRAAIGDQRRDVSAIRNHVGVGADPCVGPGADTRVRPYSQREKADSCSRERC